MENYLLEFPERSFRYQSDIFDFYIANEAIINVHEGVYYSHNLEATNLLIKEIKNVFVVPRYKSTHLKKISEDFTKGDIIILELDFQMIKYKSEDASRIILEENNKGSMNQFTNMLALLEPFIESKKHYLLKFSKSGIQKNLVSEIK